MRRLLRWTFNALAATSLLLCLATAALWVRSYWVYDVFTAQRPEASRDGQYGERHYQCLVMSYQGDFAAWWGWSERPEDRPTPPWVLHLEHPADPLLAWARFNFGYRRFP